MTTSNVALADLPISEPLTWDEICARYPEQWVCLVEMQGITDTEFEFSRARVVGHGKSATRFSATPP